MANRISAEDSPTDSSPPAPRPPFETLVWRALRLRCPRCGKGKLFINWLQMPRRCSECGLLIHRGPGYYLGSTYVNYGLTALITTVVFVIGRLHFNISSKTLLAPLLIFCLVFPLLIFRHARSLWLAMDCQFDRAVLDDSDDPEQA